jgi:hypothetical protein
MLSKSLPRIIFNKWTFIDLMSNLMVVCATWKIWSWNSIHNVTPSIPIHTPLTMLPFYWLNLGSLYLILIAIGTHYAIIGSTFSKTIVSCLVTSTDSTPLDILIPWITTFFQQHNESKIQKFELFVQTFHSPNSWLSQ